MAPTVCKCFPCHATCNIHAVLHAAGCLYLTPGAVVIEASAAISIALQLTFLFYFIICFVGAILGTVLRKSSISNFLCLLAVLFNLHFTYLCCFAECEYSNLPSRIIAVELIRACQKQILFSNLCNCQCVSFPQLTIASFFFVMCFFIK